MNTKLHDSVAIVTGASRGIGRAIAIGLATEGARLVLAARSRDGLEDTAAQCDCDVRLFPADLREPDAPQRLIDFALAEFGTIDVLVNNAGATRRGDFLELTEADWEDGFALKFFSTVRCSRAAWPHLVRTQGAIVNIVGVGGRTGSAEFSIGGSVNAALLNLTKSLADRGLTDGVKVNAINPGSVRTERLETRIRAVASESGLSLDEAAAAMAKKLGVARFGDPAEIAAAVTFLASPLSAYCQGTILDVDGGQTRTL
ncbi:glucose 1-dehydrogenase [Niveibacterium umoris]|uniref:3-oxoacyl-[acyl-carrier protein] reductase n=1 Tax=Niveibacterium umoris TaxID=1193620 RepID=A0A840BS76_9RHOO|nr:SDR family oxidoreductase [Niveibacterium umoris]MBB4013237.1 3-oxoacyl-[acyl-carrier protein] reductase [Niveibacterium umoris]